ncbi:hypothetical protein PFICI_05764 [Pestalotiopsis fici W106-1]|uniref:Carrier domain-containing protein n=1 Tax=Pestalotiopsis fici (strain W106-1 / CGMCC3.15140) TaxID=1229662 RepID=W3XCR1_PESFW|nr:uncharacterized protein PFICI_05764 [Pestalotiopsis fici W106-1]ETS83888.1 hypothetical protein PFICI_05764 [Pestalotiopsis fici W106-1]
MVTSEDNNVSTKPYHGSVSNEDLSKIWCWNAVVPEPIDACVHQIISERIVREHQAVCAWDGSLTYGELDDFSSRLANYLITFGARPETVVPLCFEKSMWMPVAMMAVMKAGAASCAVDVTQPEARLETIMGQIMPEIILTSKQSKDLASRISHTGTIVTLDKASLDRLPMSTPNLRSTLVGPDNALYLVFTSGSTGTPKGVIITHRNFSSALVHQTERLGFKRSSRVLDFASYAFDAAWYNVLHTFYAGGCLCIPSEESRYNDLSRSICQLQPNFANLTPKICGLLDEAALGILNTIELAGEAADPFQVARMRSKTTVRFAYGPSECSILSTVSTDTATCSNLGHGLGVRVWIVDGEDDSMLAAVGSVGELWVEGPLVGRGYFNDETKTSEAFVEDPSWLARGGPGYPGRLGRLYRTGDLVRYDNSNDGSLLFVGRKDAQVKIRGQRVELGEVEQQILERLPTAWKVQLVVDMVKPKESENPMLTAFLVSPDASQATIEHVQEDLMQALPIYMIPSFFLPVDEIPMTQTGKTDRRKLRQWGAGFTVRQLSDMNLTRAPWRPPESTTEKQLQRLWAAVLNIDVCTVSADDNFLRIGGDSIGAMRLVVAAREENLSLQVADVFKQPRLRDLARVAKLESSLETDGITVAPFSLLGRDMESLRKIASDQCGVPVSQVEDIFPCTPLQEGLLALSAKKPNSYMVFVNREMRAGVDLGRFKAAWERVVALSQGLRTRIVDLGSHGLMQAVIDEGIEWISAAQCDNKRAMGLGTPLTRIEVVTESENNRRLFRLTIHHAMCDGWSVPLVFDMAMRIYQGESMPPPPPFQAFINHVQNLDKAQARNVWRQQFQNMEAQVFPQLPTATYQPQADGEIAHLILDLRWPSRNSTPATLIKAAWSILTAQYTSSSEALFGMTVTGRQANVPGVELMTGPTVATVPVRIQLDRNQTVEQLLQCIQEQSLDTMAVEQMGLQWIRSICAESERACQFQTLIVIQPPSRKPTQPDQLFEAGFEGTWGLGTFNPYALLLEFQLQSEGVLLRASFDSNIVARSQMQRIIDQFETVLRQLCIPGKGSKCLSTIETMSAQDLGSLWSWNASVPQPLDRCVQDIVSETASKQPGAVAISAFDGDLTYSELEMKSDWVAAKLYEFGFEPGVVVPLCFEKSQWTPVMMLGVLKAGGTFTLLTPSLPRARLAAILDAVRPKVVITSLEHRDLFGTTPTLCPGDLVLEERGVTSNSLPYRGSLSTPVAVQFTSGTTGKPKGILLGHACISTTAFRAAQQFSVGPHTRLFQFSSYLFDVSIYDTFIALTSGACLCIPSEYARENDLAASLVESRANWVFLPPSVARTIPTDSARNLQALVLGGEAVTDADVAKWADEVNTFNWYGPAECALSCQTPVKRSAWNTGSIGSNFFCNCWVVERENPSALAPIGVVGELVLQGPGLMRGYLDDEEKTAAAFIVDPPWLLRGAPGHRGRRGRLYRTGDLARYNSDGTLTYMGRKDSQVKLRGQRVELGDIEHHVLLSLVALGSTATQVVAEVITPKGTSNEMLAAFVETEQASFGAREGLRLVDHSLTVSLGHKLVDILPRHMIPAAYLAIKTIPITPNGKLDRKKLRTIGSLLELEQLTTPVSAAQAEHQRQPETNAERQLQKLWGAILGTKNQIGTEDNFLQIGGDSIAAMRLVSAARKEGLSFTVSEVFKKPRLCDLARAARPVGKAVRANVERFSLLQNKLRQDTFLHEELPRHLCSSNSVIDCFPVTSWQTACVDLARRTPPRQWSHFIFDLPAGYTRSDAVKVCGFLWDNMEILRVIFVEHQGTYYQVLTEALPPTILHYSTTGTTHDNITSRVCEDDLQHAGVLGTPFTRFSVLASHEDPPRIILRLSHAQYDSTTLLHAMRILVSFLGNETKPRLVNFPSFLQHAASNERSCRTYWSGVLRSSKVSKLKSDKRGDRTSSSSTAIAVHKTFSMPRSSTGFTPATMFTAACALFLARATGTSDVTFGRLVSGRAMLPVHVRDTIGPCVNIIPVRVTLDSEFSWQQASASVHEQHADSLPYETIGFDKIVSDCTDWPSDVKSFGCVTHYQDLGDAEAQSAGINLQIKSYKGSSALGRLMGDNVLMISARPTGGHLEVELATAGGHYTVNQLQDWINSLAAIMETEKYHSNGVTNRSLIDPASEH